MFTEQHGDKLGFLQFIHGFTGCHLSQPRAYPQKAGFDTVRYKDALSKTTPIPGLLFPQF